MSLTSLVARFEEMLGNLEQCHCRKENASKAIGRCKSTSLLSEYIIIFYLYGSDLNIVYTVRDMS